VTALLCHSSAQAALLQLLASTLLLHGATHMSSFACTAVVHHHVLCIASEPVVATDTHCMLLTGILCYKRNDRAVR
jgi:hypothetical protein